jgi:hypothetical protein
MTRASEAAQHLLDIQSLAGEPPPNAVAAASERNALEAGARFAPTPYGLGSEGCMAAISQYVLQPVAQQYGYTIPRFTSSSAFLRWAEQHSAVVTVQRHSIDALTVRDLAPGDILVGAKGDGNHVMVMARVPANWGWNPADLMAIGNTGLPQFGPPAMRLAQEYIGPSLARRSTICITG